MDKNIEGRIFIDGLVLKDINQIFNRLNNINLMFGDVLDKEDWRLIFEHTKYASMLIPPMKDKLTNNFNNQFILQSNSSFHKSSYQCVVCGSFNVDEEARYTDGHVTKKTITCKDCINNWASGE